MGGILHRKRIGQVKDFAGLEWGSITPTDIDMSLDFQGKLFVFVDFKYKDAPFPDGQRKHLEYLVDAIAKGGAKAVACVAIHGQEIGQDIACKSAIVESRYYLGKWEPRSVDVLEFIDSVAAHFKFYVRPTISCKKEIAEQLGIGTPKLPVWNEEEKGYPESWVMCDSERY